VWHGFWCVQGRLCGAATATARVRDSAAAGHRHEKQFNTQFLVSDPTLSAPPYPVFGFAGGITNALAVTMLFDRIPWHPWDRHGIIGSGVIPKRFKEIRSALKRTIMGSFFDIAYLEAYLNERGSKMLADLDVKAMMTSAMNKPGFDETFARKLEAVSQTPDGMLLQSIASMFGGFDLMAPAFKPMIAALGGELQSAMVGSGSSGLDIGSIMPIAQIRDEIDSMMEAKLLLLTPHVIKRLIEDIIRAHLGWLVVWGNIFGGVIGLVCAIAGY